MHLSPCLGKGNKKAFLDYFFICPFFLYFCIKKSKLDNRIMYLRPFKTRRYFFKHIKKKGEISLNKPLYTIFLDNILMRPIDMA